MCLLTGANLRHQTFVTWAYLELSIMSELHDVRAHIVQKILTVTDHEQGVRVVSQVVLKPDAGT